MIRRPPTSTQSRSSAASDVYKRQSIYNVYGQEIWRKSLGKLDGGVHRTLWGGKDIQGEPVVSGVYFYIVYYGDKSLISKMSLIK